MLLHPFSEFKPLSTDSREELTFQLRLEYFFDPGNLRVHDLTHHIVEPGTSYFPKPLNRLRNDHFRGEEHRVGSYYHDDYKPLHRSVIFGFVVVVIEFWSRRRILLSGIDSKRTLP